MFASVFSVSNLNGCQDHRSRVKSKPFVDRIVWFADIFSVSNLNDCQDRRSRVKSKPFVDRVR
jgi:hypothetical protein